MASAWNAVDGVASAVPVLPNQAGQSAASAMNMPVVTLQLKAIDQKELRTFSAEYNSSKAVKRLYRPQGFFGFPSKIPDSVRSKLFLEVDTNSEFWRKFEVRAHGPALEDYARLGLHSSAVQIDYGTSDTGTNHVSKALSFSPADPVSPKVFATPMIGSARDYRHRMTFAFAAGSAWEGDPSPRTLLEARSDVRDLYLVPEAHFRFVTVTASFVSPPDWNELSQIHLRITCSTMSNTLPETFRRTVVIHPGWVPSLIPVEPPPAGANLPWQLRFKDPSPQTPLSIRYGLTYFHQDRDPHETDIIETDRPTLVLKPTP